MEKLVIIFALLCVIWVAYRRRKRRIASNDTEFNGLRNSSSTGWGKEECSCGTPRNKWKPLAMNRPDNTVLLYCPQCLNLWEENMSMYGNKWRPVDEIYAKESYNYVGNSRLESSTR